MASVAAHTATTASNTDSSSSSLFYLRPEVAILKRILDDFVEQECIPAEAEYDAHMATRHGANRWTMDAIPPCMERLKRRAKTLGLWNIFIPPRLLSHLPAAALAQGLGPTIALSYREYGIFCESLGKSPRIAPEACNTSAPDTGNMEVLLEFGSPHQQEQYLLPLLQGSIRSTFLMTEPAVASSDATNLQTKLTVRPRKSSSLRKQTLDEDSVKEYVLTGHKWWSTGAMDPRCRVALVVAKMDYSQQLYYHQQDTNRGGSSSSSRSSNSKCTNESSLHDGAQTIVVIPLPHPNVTIVTEPLTVFGYDDAPHGHAQVILNNVSLSHRDLVGGVGSGFRIAQARLGPGRIHHCMRAIGMAARCYELMLQRTLERRTFGKYLYEHGGMQEVIADSYTDLHAARVLTLACASQLDHVGGGNAKHARSDIAMIKVAVPHWTYNVVDRAVQAFGGQGVEGQAFVARCLIQLRTLRIADGPDAVHKRTMAKLAIKAAQKKKAAVMAATGATSFKQSAATPEPPLLPPQQPGLSANDGGGDGSGLHSRL